MLRWLRPLFIAFVAAVREGGITGGIAWVLRRSKPLVINTSGGAIAPDKVTAVFTITAGMFLAALGAQLFVSRGEWSCALLAVIGTSIAGFMAPSLTTIHVVRWDANSIDGPCRLFGPTLGISRTTISWPVLIKTGKTLTGYWFVEARDGRRVYWSYLYKGHGAFIDVLKRRCPHLDVPDSR